MDSLDVTIQKLPLGWRHQKSLIAGERHAVIFVQPALMELDALGFSHVVVADTDDIARLDRCPGDGPALIERAPAREVVGRHCVLTLSLQIIR